MTVNLYQMERPSRYTGGEKGAVTKNAGEVSLRIALAFPDAYEIAMSHLGLKILYGLINRRQEFWAERVMTPWPDMEAELRRTGRPLAALESGDPLHRFDVVGFSLQYELSYTNVLAMLDLGGIPLLAADRGPGDPVIIGGGPGAYNPEPLAPFFDFFFLGDAEAGFLEILDRIAAWKASGGTRRELYEDLAGRPGVYIPSWFEPQYGEHGRLAGIRPLRPGYDRAVRAVAPDIDAAWFPDCFVTPAAKPVHDRISVEIARGCTRGCRFCQAGFIYRPVRERAPQTVLDLMGRALAASGHEEASFLSLSAGDYSRLADLMPAFMDAYSQKYVALSLPSLRVKSLNPALMRQIKRVRKTGFTLAPEAGTQRLRDVINKDLTEEDLLAAAKAAFSLGWRLIKLYFMIGLPTETLDDAAAIAGLAERVKAGTRGRINVSFAAFVPKPHTPFQWEPMLDGEEIDRRMYMLKDLLRRPGLKPKWNPSESSRIEAVLSRGDRRLAPVVRAVFEQGARFEAWTEKLDPAAWYEAMQREGLAPEEYTGARPLGDPLPWSHLSAGPEEGYLLAERERALAGQTTPDCRDGACGGCGVCDFDQIEPRLRSDDDRIDPPAVSPPQGERERFRINYRKTGPTRALSHLETVDAFVRAVRRAGLDFFMSQGFTPHPRINFDTPLPVGVEGNDEWLTLDLVGPPDPEDILCRLKKAMPSGLEVMSVAPLVIGGPRPRPCGAVFQLTSVEPLFQADRLEAALDTRPLMLTKKSKKGPRDVDLHDFLQQIQLLTPMSIELTLKTGPGGTVRPEIAAQAVFQLEPRQLAGADVVKLRTLFETPG